MTENRNERIVRMAAAFPRHNSKRPVMDIQVGIRFSDEVGPMPAQEGIDLVNAVVALVNSRPADPFEGIA